MKNKYNWDIDVGQSFDVTVPESGKERQHIKKRMTSLCARYKRTKDRHYSTKMHPDKIVITRLK